MEHTGSNYINESELVKLLPIVIDYYRQQEITHFEIHIQNDSFRMYVRTKGFSNVSNYLLMKRSQNKPAPYDFNCV
ncbi:hypothetical protein BLOT_016121 [Blomia tropicalis]|nr:hypothetical protein BLOT_016121 [Blomia tropicalis]